MRLRHSGKIAIAALLVTSAGVAAAGYYALKLTEPALRKGAHPMMREPNMIEAMISANPSAVPAPIASRRLTRSISPTQDQVILPPTAGDAFASFTTNGVQLVTEQPVSTFSVDVDTASYAYVRRALQMGQLPPKDSVRVEEMINYFDYDYAAPPKGGAPFAARVTATPSPWSAGNRLVHIGIKGQAIELREAPPANLAFLIDTSGSMNAPDKLPLLKRAFTLLVNEMRPNDKISIVTYAGTAGVALEPTPASDKAKILGALEALTARGSTAGGQGIVTAYRLAEQAFIKGGTNRVLLATDGDFNVGISKREDLEQLIAEKRRGGVFLSVLGFGTGNYNDAGMQALAQAGNGNAAYIDSFSEARKVLVEQLGGTLMTIAKDVKVQVEFNPDTVSEYRLIGYETRMLKREDFNNDAVDAGDIGAGHSVTALYEITPRGEVGILDPLRYQQPSGGQAGANGGEYGFVKIRYKAPDGNVSALIETPIASDAQLPSLDVAALDTRFAIAVAAFGQKLRNPDALGKMDWPAIRLLAQSGRGADVSGRRGEFIQLIDIAANLETRVKTGAGR